MNDIENKSEQPTEESKVLSEPQGYGIFGDTNTHDMIMTRLWVKDNILENIDIRVLGSEFIICQAKKLEQQLKGQNMEDVQFLLGLEIQSNRNDLIYPLDSLFESLKKAINDFHQNKNKIHESQTEQDDILDQSTDENKSEGG